MLLDEAEQLILPYLMHDGIEKLEETNKSLHVILQKIREIGPTLRTNHMHDSHVELDKETASLFLECAQICEENLK